MQSVKSVSRNLLLAKAHIAASELGLDEGIRRDFIAARFGGRRSCKDLSDQELIRLLNYFRDEGWQPVPPRDPELDKPTFFKKRLHYWQRELPHERAGMATCGQLAMIEARWERISKSPQAKRQQALRKFLFARFGVSDLMFLSEGTASRVIEGLKSIGQRSTQMNADKDQEMHC